MAYSSGSIRSTIRVFQKPDSGKLEGRSSVSNCNSSDSINQETDLKCLRMNGDVPSVARMVQFLYTGDFSLHPSRPRNHILKLQEVLSLSGMSLSFTNEDRTIALLNMYVLADRYELPTLKACVLSKVVFKDAKELYDWLESSVIQHCSDKDQDQDLLLKLGAAIIEHWDEIQGDNGGSRRFRYIYAIVGEIMEKDKSLRSDILDRLHFTNRFDDGRSRGR